MVVSCSYLIFLEGQGSWDAPFLGVRRLLFHCLFDVWCFCVVFMKPGASWPMGAKKLPDESGGNQSVAPQVRPGGLKHRRNDSARQRMSTHLLIQASALRPKSTTDCSLDSWTTQGNSLCIISFLDSFQWVWSKYTSAMKSIRVFTCIDHYPFPTIIYYSTWVQVHISRFTSQAGRLDMFVRLTTAEDYNNFKDNPNDSSKSSHDHGERNYENSMSISPCEKDGTK